MTEAWPHARGKAEQLHWLGNSAQAPCIPGGRCHSPGSQKAPGLYTHEVLQRRALCSSPIRDRSSAESRGGTGSRPADYKAFALMRRPFLHVPRPLKEPRDGPWPPFLSQRCQKVSHHITPPRLSCITGDIQAKNSFSCSLHTLSTPITPCGWMSPGTPSSTHTGGVPAVCTGLGAGTQSSYASWLL